MINIIFGDYTTIYFVQFLNQTMSKTLNYQVKDSSKNFFYFYPDF